MNERKTGERRCSKCKRYSARTSRRHGGVFCESCLAEIEPRVGGRLINNPAQRARVRRILGV